MFNKTEHRDQFVGKHIVTEEHDGAYIQGAFDTAEEANELADRLNHKYTVDTSEGQVLEPNRRFVVVFA